MQREPARSCTPVRLARNTSSRVRPVVPVRRALVVGPRGPEHAALACTAISLIPLLVRAAWQLVQRAQCMPSRRPAQRQIVGPVFGRQPGRPRRGRRRGAEVRPRARGPVGLGPACDPGDGNQRQRRGQYPSAPEPQRTHQGVTPTGATEIGIRVGRFRSGASASSSSYSASRRCATEGCRAVARSSSPRRR